MEQIYFFINNLFINGVWNGLLSILLGIIVLKYVNKLLNSYIDKKADCKKPLLIRLKHILLFTSLAIIIALQFKATQNLTKILLTSSGIIAVIIGLLSQEAASNIINGMMIMFYHPYQINDFISVPNENIKGKVIDIALRHTIIETLEKTQLIVPNTIMNKAIIENITDTTGVKVNHLVINISYRSDINKAMSIIEKLALKHPLFIDSRTQDDIKNNKPAINIYCLDLLDSSIQLRADITTKDNVDGFQLLSDLRIEVLSTFKENNIEIPFPQVVVHEPKK